MKPKGRANLPEFLKPLGRNLIYAEGTVTEINYVKELRGLIAEKLGVRANQVELIPVPMSHTKHTLDLIKFAYGDVNKRLKKEETVDNVWIFYDKDDFPDFSVASPKIKSLKKKLPEIEWYDCWSVECFEVWLYHYFENLVVPLSRNQYIGKINAFLKKHHSTEIYEKTCDHIHKLLTDNGGDIKRAINLVSKKSDLSLMPRPNPSTGVWLFADFVVSYLEKTIIK